MEMLVEVNNKEVWAESHLVARKFGMTHQAVTRTIKLVITRLKRYRKSQAGTHSDEFTPAAPMPKYKTVEREYRGAKFTAYLMNREFFSLVATRFDNEKAFEWQCRFVNAFFAMEKSLTQVQTNAADLDWQGARGIGKVARTDETDAIKEFVDYATEQGSKSAKMYYKHVTNASYRALGFMVQKHPKLREELNTTELVELLMLEKYAAFKLREYMALGRQYKDIFQTVRDDLITYSKGVRLSPFEPTAPKKLN